MKRLEWCSGQADQTAGRRQRNRVLLLAAVAIFAAVQSAWAWGPGTHVEIAHGVLSQLALLPAAVAAILARYTTAYVYGTVAADIVFAKRLSRVKQFCHHWSTGFRLLDKADTDESRAFAYGYLSHLAADTVAHGKYVPRQITLARSTMNFGHFYWEWRADALAHPLAWRRLRQVFSENQQHHHEALAAHLRGTFLPYPLNRRVFERLNRTAMHPLPRRTVEALADYSRFPLSRSELVSYRAECVDRTLSLLQNGPACALMREDPNGAAALLHVRWLKRDLRRMERRGQSTSLLAREMTSSMAPVDSWRRDLDAPVVPFTKAEASPSLPAEMVRSTIITDS